MAAWAPPLSPGKCGSGTLLKTVSRLSCRKTYVGPTVLQYHLLFAPLIFLLHPLIAQLFVQVFIYPSIFPFVDHIPGLWDSVATQTQLVPSEDLVRWWETGQKKKKEANCSRHTTWCKRGPLCMAELFSRHIRRGARETG